MTEQPTPKCWIVGGTNGSGKSSIYQNSLELRGAGEFVNADLVTMSSDVAMYEPLQIFRLPFGLLMKLLFLRIAALHQ